MGLSNIDEAPHEYIVFRTAGQEYHTYVEQQAMIPGCDAVVTRGHKCDEHGKDGNALQKVHHSVPKCRKSYN